MSSPPAGASRSTAHPERGPSRQRLEKIGSAAGSAAGGPIAAFAPWSLARGAWIRSHAMFPSTPRCARRSAESRHAAMPGLMEHCTSIGQGAGVPEQELRGIAVPQSSHGQHKVRWVRGLPRRCDKYRLTMSHHRRNRRARATRLQLFPAGELVRLSSHRCTTAAKSREQRTRSRISSCSRPHCLLSRLR